jgi:hypothetical protein
VNLLVKSHLQGRLFTLRLGLAQHDDSIPGMSLIFDSSPPRAAVALSLLVLAGLCWPLASPLRAQTTPADLTPRVVARNDRLARARPPQTAAPRKRDVQGNLLSWAISNVPLSAEEEARHSSRVERELLRHFRQSPTPLAASALFDRLIARLPGRMRPPEFTYNLTVLDDARPNAFTVGGGRLFITSGLLDSLLSAGDRGRGMMSFILAHELGHVALGHCRNGFQWQELAELAKRGLDKRVTAGLAEVLLKTTIDTSAGFARFVYVRDQVFEADRFAWQLCRNAGVPPEHALDALRYFCLLAYPRITEDPDDHPQPLADRSGLAISLSSHVDPLLRLQRLWQEAAGVADERKAYGMYSTHAETGALVRAADGLVPAGAKALIFVHGMEGDLQSLRAAREHLQRHAAAEGRHILVFWYPNDQSLARSGEFLFKEIDRVGGDPSRFDFVCHSAGGLVFRYYAQAKRGGFDRAVFLATPHGGSDLARLRGVLEAVQFVKRVQLGFPEALEQALVDGQGQIKHDLLPDSLFLQFLEQCAALPLERCHVIRGSGRRRDQLAWMAASAGLDQLRPHLRPRGQSALLDRFLEHSSALLELPEEITRGDLCVALERATLAGLPDARLHTLRENHVTIKDAPQTLALLEAILLGNGFAPE